MALACSRGWLNRSAGYVDFSDGWQDLSRHKLMTWRDERAELGDVAFVGENPDRLVASPDRLGVRFGSNTSEAALGAIVSLEDDY